MIQGNIEGVTPEQMGNYSGVLKILNPLPLNRLPFDFGFLTPTINNLPINDIADTFSGITIELVPRDMIRIIQAVLKMLFDTVQKSTGKVIGADEMFPLFLCVLIRSNMYDIADYIKFLDNFLTSDEKLGESGYCLVTLSASYMYLCSLKVEDLKKL